MHFNFYNMDDSSLRDLSSAVSRELRKRLLANVSNFPMPVITDGGIEDVKRYYHVYHDSHGVSLVNAKIIVEYWSRTLMYNQES